MQCFHLNVRVECLLPNITSRLQPLVRGTPPTGSTPEKFVDVSAADLTRVVSEGNLTFMDFLQVDDEVAIFSAMTDKDGIFALQLHGDSGNQDDDVDDDDEPPQPIPP